VPKLGPLRRADKLGFDTGLKVKHPFTGNAIPVWIANFVLMGYGTGAIFGCPAHDQRDLDFARKYDLDVTPVVLPWGCPIPVIHCAQENGKSCGVVPVPEADLPVALPYDINFDKPGNPLDRHPTFKDVDCPKCGKPARRETDTLDTFADSSWYFARFAGGNTADEPFDKKTASDWLPVDQYVGGIEHAVMHLLYSRRAGYAIADYSTSRAVNPLQGYSPKAWSPMLCSQMKTASLLCQPM